MAGGKPRRLRWRLTVPLAAAFAALWLGTMALFTLAARDEIEQTVDIQYQSARYWMGLHSQGYQASLTDGIGTGPDTRSAYQAILSGEASRLKRVADGGMALMLRDEAGTPLRSQLAWGLGNEEGFNRGQRWYLELDPGLDDQGQLALARWIAEHQENSGGTFLLYPPDDSYGPTPGDGSYARVTGVEQPGHTIAVQKLELVRPDGTAELVVETSIQGENPIVVELAFLELRSILLPDSGAPGADRRMERCLANFREAQAILDRELAGEDRAVQAQGGRLLSSASDEALSYFVAGQCDVTAAVLEQEWRLYLSTFALLILVVLLLSKRLSKQVTAPVEALSLEVQGGRCQTDGPVSELNALARAFNAAQDQLAGQLERERAFTRSAAHELKTPLAVLRAHGEALREDIRPEKRAEYLEILLDECDRMAGLVGSLLELSCLESGAALRREPVELSALVREVWEPLALPLEQKQISLTLALEEVRLEGDRARLREAAGNLASNALRHCPPGGHIQVVLEAAEGQARLTVCNDGPPIPEEDLPRLFEPFYRGDKSRSRESGGTGLGLAIVRAAVLAHGGRCGAENRPGGAAFWLTLPQQLQEDPKPL